jgi:bacteriocin biosynthesis cyclodehydratase domain-containing protein
MKFPSSLNENVKIRLAPGVSKFVADSGSLFIKHNNRLFRLSSSSDIEKRSRILDILEEPRKLIEITNILSEFRRNDLIAFLRNLYRVNLVELEESTPEYNIRSSVSDDGSSATSAHESVNSMTAKRLVGSKILLIGDGILKNKLAAYFRSIGIQYEKISSFVSSNQNSDQMGPNDIKGTQEREQLRERGLLSFHHPSFSDEYDLIVAAQDYPNIIFFETVNKICFNKKKPWLRVSFDDNIGFLGPLVIPGQTSCYDCCELRLVTNSPYYEYFLWKYKEHIPKARLPPSKLLVDILAALCANEIISHLTKANKPETIGHLFLLDLRQMHLSKHKIVPYPSCTYCNIPRAQKHTLSKLDTTSRGQLTRNEAPKGPTRYMVSYSESLSTEKELLQKLKELEDEKTGMVSKSEKLFDSNILGIKFHHFYDVTCYNPLRINRAFWV